MKSLWHPGYSHIRTVTIFGVIRMGVDTTPDIFGIDVRAGGARGAAAPPNFGQLRFFGQREKIWAKPVFKDVSILFDYFKDLNINLKSA